MEADVEHEETARYEASNTAMRLDPVTASLTPMNSPRPQRRNEANLALVSSMAKSLD
jgi:hypothetical protein